MFGTDGIRGKMNEAPLQADWVKRLSYVVRQGLPDDAILVVGCDTRASCRVLRSWVFAYLGGLKVLDLGVVPTPVVAFETKARGATLGIMLTASHNPASDNGLKFFDRSGLKIKRAQAEDWSVRVQRLSSLPPEKPAVAEPVRASHYRAFIQAHFSPADFSGFKPAFDLAHGAGSFLIKDLANMLKLNAVFLGDHPNGMNINLGVGALHTDRLSERVKAQGLDVGFALDGDGDRLIVTAPDELRGDVVLYALWRILKQQGRSGNAVVGTIMCGMGLERALQKEGVALIRTPVGDQHVLAELVEKKLALGGEPSGHLIQADLFPAGDGFLAALTLAKALNECPEFLDHCQKLVPNIPVLEKAYRVKAKPPMDSVPALSEALEALRFRIGETGRLIVRYSGTEPKLRLYIESVDLDLLGVEVQAFEDALVETLT